MADSSIIGFSKRGIVSEIALTNASISAALFRRERGFERQRLIQNCHILTAFDDLAHQFAAGRRPRTVFDKGYGTV